MVLRPDNFHGTLIGIKSDILLGSPDATGQSSHWEKYDRLYSAMEIVQSDGKTNFNFANRPYQSLEENYTLLWF